MRPDDPLTLFPETAIPVARLARAGLQTSRSRRVDLRVPNRGIRARRDEPPTPRDLAVANAQGDRSLIVSHESAAQVWGMWLPEGRRVRPHLSRRAGRGAPRITGVVGHRLRIGDRRLVEIGPADGRFWVTNPTWTWTDLPSCGLRLEALIEAGDSLLQRSDGAPRPPLVFGASPLATVEELRAVVDERSNVAGVPLLREALEHLRPRSDSPRETRLRRWIVREGLPEPLVNPQIVLEVDARGRVVDSAPVDLVYDRARIAVQYEGAHHFSSPEQVRRDMRRDERLRAAGWEVLRVDKDVFTPQGWARFVRRLRSLLALRG